MKPAPMRALGAGTEVVGLRVADVPSPAALLLKTRLLTIIVVLTQVMGDYFLSYGLRRVGSLVGRPPLDFIVALTNPWVALGVLLLILWLFSHMVLLSWADLSYVLPVTSIGYVLVTLTGRFLLHETVSWMRWGGVILIVAGVILVGRTAPSTKPLQPEEGA